MYSLSFLDNSNYKKSFRGMWETLNYQYEVEIITLIIWINISTNVITIYISYNRIINLLKCNSFFQLILKHSKIGPYTFHYFPPTLYSSKNVKIIVYNGEALTERSLKFAKCCLHQSLNSKLMAVRLKNCRIVFKNFLTFLENNFKKSYTAIHFVIWKEKNDSIQ